MVVVMSLSRMASVDYLVGHVAAGDGRAPSTGSPLTRYYAAEGYPPGTWLGSGLAGLGVAELAGTEVTEKQLRVLFEDARSPFDGSPLGRPPVKYPTRQERIDRRIGGLPEATDRGRAGRGDRADHSGGAGHEDPDRGGRVRPDLLRAEVGVGAVGAGRTRRAGPSCTRRTRGRRPHRDLLDRGRGVAHPGRRQRRCAG